MEITKEELDKIIAERDFYQRAYTELLQKLSSGQLTSSSTDGEPVKATTKTESEMKLKLDTLSPKRLALLSAMLLDGAKTKDVATEIGVSYSALRSMESVLRTKFGIEMPSRLYTDPELIQALEGFNDEIFKERTGVPKHWWRNKEQYIEQVRQIQRCRGAVRF